MRGRFIRIISLFVSRFVEKLASRSDCSFSAFISEFDTETYLSITFDPHGSLSRISKISILLIVNIQNVNVCVTSFGQNMKMLNEFTIDSESHVDPLLTVLLNIVGDLFPVFAPRRLSERETPTGG